MLYTEFKQKYPLIKIGLNGNTEYKDKYLYISQFTEEQKNIEGNMVDIYGLSHELGHIVDLEDKNRIFLKNFGYKTRNDYVYCSEKTFINLLFAEIRAMCWQNACGLNGHLDYNNFEYEIIPQFSKCLPKLDNTMSIIYEKCSNYWLEFSKKISYEIFWEKFDLVYKLIEAKYFCEV